MTTYDIPAIDSYGNKITLRLSCVGPAIVTMEILTADTAQLAEYHVSITNTGALLTGISACDRAARLRHWPATDESPVSRDGDDDFGASLPPMQQVGVAHSMLGNALRYGPGVIRIAEAEKWLEFLLLHAKAGAAAVTPTTEEDEADRGD